MLFYQNRTAIVKTVIQWTALWEFRVSCCVRLRAGGAWHLALWDIRVAQCEERLAYCFVRHSSTRGRKRRASYIVRHSGDPRWVAPSILSSEMFEWAWPLILWEILVTQDGERLTLTFVSHLNEDVVFWK